MTDAKGGCFSIFFATIGATLILGLVLMCSCAGISAAVVLALS